MCTQHLTMAVLLALCYVHLPSSFGECTVFPKAQLLKRQMWKCTERDTLNLPEMLDLL